jgi:predicted lysophospholipase L1 biosynthesis ABC-type transport system permease subunit
LVVAGLVQQVAHKLGVVEQIQYFLLLLLLAAVVVAGIAVVLD